MAVWDSRISHVIMSQSIGEGGAGLTRLVHDVEGAALGAGFIPAAVQQSGANHVLLRVLRLPEPLAP